MIFFNYNFKCFPFQVASVIERFYCVDSTSFHVLHEANHHVEFVAGTTDTCTAKINVPVKLLDLPFSTQAVKKFKSSLHNKAAVPIYSHFVTLVSPWQSRKLPTESFQVSSALRGLPPSWCHSRSTLRLKDTNSTWRVPSAAVPRLACPGTWMTSASTRTKTITSPTRLAFAPCTSSASDQKTVASTKWWQSTLWERLSVLLNLLSKVRLTKDSLWLVFVLLLLLDKLVYVHIVFLVFLVPQTERSNGDVQKIGE